MNEILYHKGRSGALYQWRTWAEGPYIYTEYGQVGGKLQISEKKAEPKNIGKKNATTAEEQAQKESEALYKYKIDRKYSLTPEDAQEELLSPMLARSENFQKAKKYITYPCYFQYKLDGLRCLAYWKDKKIVLQSRGGKFYDLPHISKELERFLGINDMVDGELYIHGKSLQTINSLVQNNSEEIEYHIYDFPVYMDYYDKDFIDRLRIIKQFDQAFTNVLRKLSNIKFVKTEEVYNEEEIVNLENRALEDGYEGGIVRNRLGKYEYGFRSKNLVKVKSFEDAEFLIVDIIADGRGKNEGIAKFVCKLNDSDQTFEVDPLGTTEYRKNLFTNKDEYIGKYLTVKYIGLTDKGIPKYAKGKAIRLKEDM